MSRTQVIASAESDPALAAAAVRTHGQDGEDRESNDQRSCLNDDLHGREPQSRALITT
jgi:hypothetical protein